MVRLVIYQKRFLQEHFNNPNRDLFRENEATKTVPIEEIEKIAEEVDLQTMKSVKRRETKINDFIPDIVNETTKIKENLDRILKILDNLNIKKTN